MNWRRITAGAALLTTTPAVANTPPPLPTLGYYGPVRHCGEGFALEARASEGLMVTRQTGGYTLASPLIRRTGSLELPGGVTLARYRVADGQPASGRVTYLFDPGGSDAPHRIEIGSDLFDGSDARLLAVDDIKAIGPDPGPGIAFSFSRPLADAQRNALVGHVRPRVPSDHCFDPDTP